MQIWLISIQAVVSKSDFYMYIFSSVFKMQTMQMCRVFDMALL